MGIPQVSDLVAIPPVLRTIIYYLIAEAIIVCAAVGSGATGWDLAGNIAEGNAILFFGTAAAKVTKTEPTKTENRQTPPTPQQFPDP